ncbi:MAG: hypothetical protein PHD13_01370 [Methanocellales archaeon]|nr:hypothetical protein [Methanocellales archaeon]MDD3290928.1 hypothetical protein [Methanocellales archaeon]MDD3292328.1 hypothetical protein [Methanocellales archaeon]MDD5234813.1 hypothetical protein [Methanocellales archaeon]MDD5484817.1 hypothetical protein [Methanocellales archaeon]
MILDVNTWGDSGYDLLKKWLITIGVKTDDGIKIWHRKDYNGEEKMLKDFLEWFVINKEREIIGFNILKSDMPLLLLKSQSVGKTKELYQRLFKSNIVDLFCILTFLNNGTMCSLEMWCKKLDIVYKGKPKHPQTTSGKIIFGTDHLINDQDTLEYQKRELIATDELHQKIVELIKERYAIL